MDCLFVCLSIRPSADLLPPCRLSHSPLLLFASFEPLCLYRKCCRGDLHSLRSSEIAKVCHGGAKTAKIKSNQKHLQQYQRHRDIQLTPDNIYCDPAPSILDFDIPSWDEVEEGLPVVNDKFGHPIEESAVREGGWGGWIVLVLSFVLLLLLLLLVC